MKARLQAYIYRLFSENPHAPININVGELQKVRKKKKKKEIILLLKQKHGMKKQTCKIKEISNKHE